MNSQQIPLPELWQHHRVVFYDCPWTSLLENLSARADSNRALMDAKLVPLTPSQPSYIRFHCLEIQFFMGFTPKLTYVFLFPSTLSTAQFSRYPRSVRLLRCTQDVPTSSRVRTCAQVNKAALWIINTAQVKQNKPRYISTWPYKAGIEESNSRSLVSPLSLPDDSF